ncbi:MAG: hypothetical protein J0L97_08010, partial [Alphaproteobacteria bacterium]|nr:hypothetical protein [Alphaproteobacteria bacterium]
GMATALGMKVVAYRRPRNLEAVPEVVVDGVRVVGDLAELYRVAHVVSPHVPLVKEGDWPTQHMIDAKALASMPKGVIVLNVARGGIIDEAALADALRSGHVAAAALDVLEVEKGTLTSPLLGAPHAVIVPHLAASSPEVQVAAAMRLVELAQAMEIMFVDRVIPEGMTASVVNPATLPNFQSLPPSIPPRL